MGSQTHVPAPPVVHSHSHRHHDAKHAPATGWLSHLTFTDKVAYVWFLLDAFTHLTMEASYVYVTWAHGGAAKSDSPLAHMWREYGKADRRWEVYDAGVLSLELVTVLLMGPLAVAMMYAVRCPNHTQPKRHDGGLGHCAGVTTSLPTRPRTHPACRFQSARRGGMPPKSSSAPASCTAGG